MELFLAKKDNIKLTVSIVIPMYNEVTNIEKCITSILKQDYPQEFIEIVVVDGS